ncbi:hypothetical protein B7463_g5281, partial [Scytalidium lignicola]
MASTSVNGCTNAHAQYRIKEQPLGFPRHLRIATIGAGAAGLNMARHLELHMRNFEHVVYEKNLEVGGTWFENRYPGCACDIPSHNYQFTWEANPDWNHFNWKWPMIPGIQSFKGDLVHSAAWDPELSVKGKKVAVLGCGSSGVQIVPTILPGDRIQTLKFNVLHDANILRKDVKELITFIRTPTWITAGFAQDKADPHGTNFKFTEQQKDLFKNSPEEYLEYRKEIENELNKRFGFIIKDSIE